MGQQLTVRSLTRCRICGKRQELPVVTDSPTVTSLSWLCSRPVCGETLTVHRQQGLSPFGPITLWLQAGEKPDIQLQSDDCPTLPPENK